MSLLLTSIFFVSSLANSQPLLLSTSALISASDPTSSAVTAVSPSPTSTDVNVPTLITTSSSSNGNGGKIFVGVFLGLCLAICIGLVIAYKCGYFSHFSCLGRSAKWEERQRTKRLEELKGKKRVDGVIDKWRRERGKNERQVVIEEDEGVELPAYEAGVVSDTAQERRT